MLTVLSAVLVVTVAVAEPPAPRSRPAVNAARIDALLQSPERRVRGVDADAALLLERGARRSYTFAQLLDALEETDVIVLVQVTAQMPLSVAGRLVLAASAHGHRFLRVQLAPAGTTEDMVAILGHELQHALEVAASPDVRDDAGMIALYKRIGHKSLGGGKHFDTLAARETGRIVRSELG